MSSKSCPSIITVRSMTARKILSGSLRPASGSGRILKRKNTGLRSASVLRTTIRKSEDTEKEEDRAVLIRERIS